MHETQKPGPNDHKSSILKTGLSFTFSSSADQKPHPPQRRPFGSNNNNNNNLDDIYSAVIYGASHMREFTAVHLGQSRPSPGGRQLAGQAANLTFESACRLLEAKHSPIATGIITQP